MTVPTPPDAGAGGVGTNFWWRLRAVGRESLGLDMVTARRRCRPRFNPERARERSNSSDFSRVGFYIHLVTIQGSTSGAKAIKIIILPNSSKIHNEIIYDVLCLVIAYLQDNR
jgi:hypothetical protein